MSFYEFDYYDEDNNFTRITYSSDANNVETVSELRHYNNCHGITKSVLDKFKTNRDIIFQIINGCYGSLYVKDLVNDPNYRQEKINERIKNDIAKFEAFANNEERILKLSQCRLNFCNIGTNKIKRRLNILSKTNYIAKLFRLALEIEDKNILAKDASFYYKDKIYAQKHNLIAELIELFKSNNLIYGKQNSNVKETKFIIYFELPNSEQISFHSDLNNPDDIPNYDKDWDGKQNSTLEKLEAGILLTFPNINLKP